MSSKKVFNLKDKVFAKIRGYPAWPAIISGVKADTPSRQRYNVYFYGTGERAECKSEELFPYEENKSKLGKPNKRKYFAEALLQIEDDNESSVIPGDDSQVSVTPSNSSHIDQESSKDESENVNEVEKSNVDSEKKSTVDESSSSKGKKNVASRKSLGLSISKGTKRKISDVKPESSSKKSLSNKPKILESLKLKERPFVLVEALKDSVVERAISAQQKFKQAALENVSTVEPAPEIIDKQSETLNTTTESVLETSDVLSDTSKTVKSLSKVKNSPTSSSEISSTNSSNVGQVSRSGRKIKPKKYSDYENDTEAPKRSRLSKEIPKSSEKNNSGNNEIDTSLEQNDKTKDTNSEIKKVSKGQASASAPHISDTVTTELDKINSEINDDDEMPATLKDLMVGALSDIETGWKKAGPKKTNKIDLLHTEVDLLDFAHKLRVSLRTDHADYEGALDSLEHISELHLNALMLKKHQEIVDTIQKVTRYIGNTSKWNLNEEETVLHEEKSTQIRRKAEMVINKFISLFTVPDGQTFQEIYNKEVEEFFTNTKHMACDQIYGLTSEKHFN